MNINLTDGTRLFVDIEGSSLRPSGGKMIEAPVLVLLHGGPGYDHSTLKPYFSRFTSHAQILYYDHRGMGRSDRSTPTHWNLERWAEDLRELINVLGIQRPILLGQSFGGFVATQYAKNYSDKLAGLILSSTAARMVKADIIVKFSKLGGEKAYSATKSWFDDCTPQSFADFAKQCMPYYNTTP